MENSDISTATASVPAEAVPPVPGAEDQKPTPPASDADAQNPEAQETPEQQEAKRESRRARSNARKAQALADARAEAKLLREERDRLNAKLEAQTQAPKGDEEPKEADFKDYTEYTRALARWEGKQAAAETLKAEKTAQQGQQKQQQEQVGTEKVAKAWAEREKSFQTATPDYEKVVGPFADEELQLLSLQARQAIVESDVGPALLHSLALLAEKDPAEYERIAELSPVRQIAELGKLEAKVSMPAKKTTNAPAPASTTTGGRTASKDLAKMSQEEYEAHRKSQGASWAR